MKMGNSDVRIFHGWRGPYLTVYCPTGYLKVDNPFRNIRRAQMLLMENPEKRIQAAKALLLGVLFSYNNWARSMNEMPGNIESLIESTRIKLLKAESVDELLGVEGVFHREIFRNWQARFMTTWGFCERNRRPPKDPINAMISYGNSIVYGLCVPPLQKFCFNTSLGFLHQPRRGRHTLALDIAELVKPSLVENVVWNLCSKGRCSIDMFEQANGGCYLNSEGRKCLRSAMYEKAENLCGKAEKNRFGWPQTLWDSLERFASRLAGDFLNLQIPELWVFPSSDTK